MDYAPNTPSGDLFPVLSPARLDAFHDKMVEFVRIRALANKKKAPVKEGEEPPPRPEGITLAERKAFVLEALKELDGLYPYLASNDPHHPRLSQLIDELEQKQQEARNADRRDDLKRFELKGLIDTAIDQLAKSAAVMQSQSGPKALFSALADDDGRDGGFTRVAALANEKGQNSSGFHEQLLWAYRRDRADIIRRFAPDAHKPEQEIPALQQTSRVLDVVYMSRWAGAASMLAGILEDYKVSLAKPSIAPKATYAEDLHEQRKLPRRRTPN